MRCAVNNGLPLNTVMDTSDFSDVMVSDASKLSGTILVTPTAIIEGTYERAILDFITSGGRVLFYGPLAEAPRAIRELLEVTIGDDVAGAVDLVTAFHTDVFEDGAGAKTILHNSNVSGGAINEQCNPGSPATKVAATAGNPECAYAITRSEKEWNGGTVAWIRGSNPFSAERVEGQQTRVPRPHGLEYFDSSVLCRSLLETFGYGFVQHRRDGSTRPALTFLSRKRNGWYLSGYAPDTTVSLELAFPDGAPVFTGSDIRLRDGRSHVQLRTSFHLECRLFVSGQSSGAVSCVEAPCFPTDMERRVAVSGLAGATIVVFPPKERLTKVFAEVDGEKITGCVDEEKGAIRYDGLSGSVSIAW